VIAAAINYFINKDDHPTVLTVNDKIYILPLLLILVCCAAPPAPDMKARLKEVVQPALEDNVQTLQDSLSKGSRKDELSFLTAEIKKVEGALDCVKENAGLDAKALEEKCKQSYLFELQARKMLLQSASQQAIDQLAVLQSAAPKTVTLTSGKISRCQSCHLLTDLPGFAAVEGAEALASHPMFEALFQTHDPKVFGCQSCHGGNEAFTSGAAHNQMLWEPNSPLQEAHVWQAKVNPSAKASDWIQSSCVSCHSQEMSLFAAISCVDDSACGEGYVCGTFEQRAALAVGKVPYAVALAQSKGEDPEKAADVLMTPIMQSSRAYAKLDDAKFAALDAAVQAIKDGKPLFEAAEAGRIAAQELIALPRTLEVAEAKTVREASLNQNRKKLTETLGKGSELFANISSTAPNEFMCVEEQSNLTRVDLAPLFTKGKMILREAGCYGCHNIPGTEALPTPGPALDRLAQKTSAGWLASWIANPKDFRPNTRMPNFFPEALEPRSIKETLGKDGRQLGRYFGFDGKVKDPRIDAQNYEPSVYQLHTDAMLDREQESAAMAAYLWSVSKNDKVMPEVSGDVARGESLFNIRGCLGCHQVEDRPVFDPAQEVPAITESCDVLTGQDCNKTKPYQSAYSHFDVAPNLSNIGNKTNAGWLYTWLKDPKSLQPNTRMPSLRLSDEDAKDLAAYLMTLTNKNQESIKAVASTPQQIEDGKTLIETYGCFQCHTIPGFEEKQKVAPDLASFGSKTALEYGEVFTAPSEKTWENWTEQKLLHPRTLDTKATMPYSQLRPDEVYALLIVLRGMRQDATPKKQYTEPETARQQGRFLVARYNCWGCHSVDGKESAILPYFETQASLGDNPEIRRSFGPPSLLGEGERVRATWLIDFLQNVVELRPWLEKTLTLEEGRTAGIRMPSFEMPVKEAELLASYFASMSQKPFPEQPVEANVLTYAQAIEGRALFKSAACEACHPYEGVGQAPSLSLAAKRLQGDWVLRWLLSPARTLPGTSRMPPFFGEPDDALRGRLFTPLTDFLGGDPAAQMIRLRDYVMVLSECPPDETLPCRVGTGATLPTSTPTNILDP
jgi:cytochrome c551/c552